MRNSGNDSAMKRYDELRLFDFYAPLVTEHRREIMRLYYEEDLSLSEISELLTERGQKVTRQGVHAALNEALRQLSSYEDALGLIKRHDELIADVKKCREALENGDNVLALRMLQTIEETEQAEDL